jgi:glycosyltransferase involved in cell wall biosynthesis
MDSPVLSIVAPAYNEEKNIPSFLAAILPVLEGIGETFEIVFVNDGSRDGTLGLLAAAASQDPRIKVVSLARNFGKDVALSAGLAHTSGAAVIPIDCDLQHPVELIPEFVAKWRDGNDMVIGVRSKRDEEGWARRTASRAYYKVMGWMTSIQIPPNAGDFRLLDRKIVDVINGMPERHRYMKGIFAWPGFKTASIDFQANARAGDASRWSFFKLWRFALDGLFSFSTAPLKVWTYVGVLTAAASFVYAVVTLVQTIVWGVAVPGYASLLIVMLFLNGLALISNGIQGEYIGRIFEEVKGRPLFVVGRTWNLGEEARRPNGVRAEHAKTPAPAPEPKSKPTSPSPDVLS